MLTIFWLDNLQERKEHLEDLGLDGNIMDLREIGWEDVDWILVAQDRDQSRELVNTIMNLRVP
jgi:hypothetical protein